MANTQPIRDPEREDNPFKIRLSSASPQNIQERRANSVVFQVTPELVENRNINYKSYDPVHAPGQIFVYQSTSSRTFQLSGIKLISRTSKEASENLARLWTLRGWTMPNFGRGRSKNGAAQSAFEESLNDGSPTNIKDMINAMSGTNARNFLGAPPQTLLLNAYSDSKGIGHIKNVPVVITQMSIPYPSESDYIPTAENNPTPMPTIMTIDIQLTETHSPNEYETFDLQDFKQGRLPGF